MNSFHTKGTWSVKVEGLNATCRDALLPTHGPRQRFWKMDMSKCAQVSEFQKGGYVHIANGDYSSDVIGEIKDLENGRLLVEVDGQKQLLGLEGIWICLKSYMF